MIPLIREVLIDPNNDIKQKVISKSEQGSYMGWIKTTLPIKQRLELVIFGQFTNWIIEEITMNTTCDKNTWNTRLMCSYNVMM
jgi:hypothetical protein